MNTQTLLNNLGKGDLSLLKGSKGELYTYFSGYAIYLLDYGFSYPATMTSTCGVATSSWTTKELASDEKNYVLWTFKKIDNVNERNCNMINPFIELKKSLSVYYPNVEDSELNDITQDFIDFFSELAEIDKEDDETTSSSQDTEVNILKNQ